MFRTFAAAATLALLATAAQAQTAAQIGTLSCDVSRGIGMFVFQKEKLACVFSQAGQPPQNYTGSIDQFGVAIGATSAGHLVWGVLSATAGAPAGALAGTYAGVGANASLIVGAGANVLVGGTGRAFSLQPISVEGQMGVNIAGGVTTLTLASAP